MIHQETLILVIRRLLWKCQLDKKSLTATKSEECKPQFMRDVGVIMCNFTKFVQNCQKSLVVYYSTQIYA